MTTVSYQPVARNGSLESRTIGEPSNLVRREAARNRISPPAGASLRGPPIGLANRQCHAIKSTLIKFTIALSDSVLISAYEMTCIGRSRSVG